MEKLSLVIYWVQLVEVAQVRVMKGVMMLASVARMDWLLIWED